MSGEQMSALEYTHTPAENHSALILNVQRLSTEDGPGIRTTVFFKGCPLSCAWCHNPESLAFKPQIQWLPDRCIGCTTCVETCPNGALRLAQEGIRINRELCKGCGTCVEACPTNALELLGTRRDLDYLVREVLKDRTFYSTSTGGVTVSGGEPTMQSAFVEKFLAELTLQEIHTALDTCGLCSWQSLERILPFVNLILFDLKVMDPIRHQEFTGQDNVIILENLERIVAYIREASLPPELWIRTPLIPGATADDDNVLSIGQYLRSTYPTDVKRWELCAFNNLCRDKYRRLGIRWRYADALLLRADRISTLERIAQIAGPPDADILATGPSRVIVQ